MFFYAFGKGEETGCVLTFKKHYDETHLFVRSVIFAHLRTEMYLDDLVQETFIKAWKSFDKFDHKSTFKTWIYRIAVNTTFDFFRKNKKVLIEWNENLEKVKEEAIWQRDLVDYAVKKMEPKYREAFILFYQLGFEYKEIADYMKLPIGTVKSRLNKAKEKFKDIIEKNGGHYE